MSLIRNASWLMVAHVGGLAIPLLELPILTRAFGREVFGQYVFAISIAVVAAVFVEFGFNLTGARSVARAGHDRAALARLVTDVNAARGLLFVGAALGVSAAIHFSIGSTKVPESWTLPILLYVFAMGFSPIWYYTGIEKLSRVAALDVFLRMSGLILLAAVVRNPEDALTALLIQSCVGSLNTIIPLAAMVRKTGTAKISITNAVRQLKGSLHMFFFKGAQSVMSSLSTLLLGLVTSGGGVGAFAPAEKLVRAACALPMPILNAAYPRFVNVHAPGNRSVPGVIIPLAIFVTIALAVSALLFIFSPRLVGLAFGEGYEESKTVLSLLVWVIPLRVGFSTLSMLWFFPRSGEAFVGRVMILNLLLSCLVGFPAAWVAQGVGLAIAMVGIDAITFSILARKAWKGGVH